MIVALLRGVCFMLWWLLIPAWPFFWLFCRLTSCQCPNCGKRWHTELVGEWEGEHWKCYACHFYWEQP